MATFQLSPGVQVLETDLTGIIPAVATDIAASVGNFQWGPVLQPTLVSSKAQVLSTFGYPVVSPLPASNVRQDWWTAVNVLDYTNALQIVRIATAGAINAVSGKITKGDSEAIYNYNDFLQKKSGLSSATGGSTYARYPGKLGNGIDMILIDASIADSDFRNTPLFGNTTAASLFTAKPNTSVWATSKGFTGLQDEVHAVVYTADASVTGVPNQVLETYSFLSKAKNALNTSAQGNYYADVITADSSWVYHLGAQYDSDYTSPTGGDIGIGSTVNSVTSATQKIQYFNKTGTKAGLRFYDLNNGSDGTAPTAGNYETGWDLFSDPTQIDVGLLISGNPLDGAGASAFNTDTYNIQAYVQNIATTRQDAVAFVSPGYFASAVTPTAQEIVNYFNGDPNNANDAGFNSTSYAFFDSGWKQQYDQYNNDYFWVPLCADMAGLTAATAASTADWFSPAGYNRGFVKNVVKLSYNPTKTDRDLLYSSRINPVITERGQGTLLFGDKTALSRPSAFDRINVRKLFIVLEKAIATAAKYQLFEFNDSFTQANFVSQVEPFLQDIQSRRGLTRFKVVCDSSNNTPQVVASNQFVADIYIQPNYSINFITLNFVAVGPNVSFTEIAGA